jgi:ABC-type transport system involved in multi-copper enzyme maturation permease subunit
MTGPQFLYATRWLIRDTFRQAMATRIFWIMLAVSGLCILFCLGIGVEGGLAPKLPHDTSLYTTGPKPKEFTGANPNPVKLSLMFGAVRVEGGGRGQEEAVHFLEVLLATWVAGSAGLLLTLIWTSGFLPEFLQPANASVLFAKPVPRSVLLLGKYLGVVAFVAFQVIVFFVGTWLAIGLRTGIWQYAYLAGIPLLMLQFAILYSFSVLLAVTTRSTVACIFGTILFFMVCWGMNLGRHYAVALAPEASLSPLTGFLTEAGYWMLPKPTDLAVLLEQTLGVGQHFDSLSRLEAIRIVGEKNAFHPELSLLASLAFAGVMLFISGRHLAATDY